MAPLDEIERIVASVDGYVVVANINSAHQAVIGGATEAVERAIEAFTAAGYSAARIPVSHAFHTAIVAPVSESLRQTAAPRWTCAPPELPIVANVDGEFYPASGPGLKDQMLDILGRQVASPVQFVKGLGTLYEAGARVFVEVGPKKALHGFAEDVLGSAHDDVLALFTNHPKFGDVPSFNPRCAGCTPPAWAIRRGPRQLISRRPCRCQPTLRLPHLPHREQPCQKTVTPNSAAWSPMSSSAAAPSSPTRRSRETPRSQAASPPSGPSRRRRAHRTARRRRCPNRW